MGGFVYVFSNPAMPGLLKIGSTEKLPTERGSQLYTTGVPEPFVLEFAMWCEHHRQVEAETHEELNDYRVASGREFFRVSVQRAIIHICHTIDNLRDNGVCVESDCCVIDDSVVHTLNLINNCDFTADQWLDGITPEMAKQIQVNYEKRAFQINALKEMAEVSHGW
jgi:hypothetical protein